jgi:hypothetical protein
MNANVRRALKIFVVALAWIAAALFAMQIVPYGRTHANPSVSAEPPWDSPHTRELAVRACFDCHSNETRWPWYADVAPVSWVVQHDVESARTVINFSAWDRPYELAQHSSQSILIGTMPPAKYRMAHPEADLSREEKLELARGLAVTLNAPGRF